MSIMYLISGLVYFGSYALEVFFLSLGLNASQDPFSYLTAWVVTGVVILIGFDLLENLKIYLFPFSEEEVNPFNIYFMFIYGLVSIFSLQIITASLMISLVMVKGFPNAIIYLGSFIPLILCVLMFAKGIFQMSEQEKFVKKFDLLEGTEAQEEFMELNNQSFFFCGEGLNIQVLYVFTVLLVLCGVYFLFSKIVFPFMNFDNLLIPCLIFYLYVLLLSAGRRNIMKQSSIDLLFRVEKTLMIGFVYFLGIMFFVSCLSALSVSSLGFTKEILIIVPLISISTTLKRVLN